MCQECWWRDVFIQHLGSPVFKHCQGSKWFVEKCYEFIMMICICCLNVIFYEVLNKYVIYEVIYVCRQTVVHAVKVVG